MADSTPPKFTPEAAPSPPSSSRRSFFNKLWVLLGVVALVELAGGLFGFFKPRRQDTGASGIDPVIIAGPADKFAAGTVTAFVRGKFYLARLEDGGFLALSRTCTHLGCTVPWVEDQKKFICPCHSSQFDMQGEVISPPAPRPLDIYPINIENNVLKVDTGKRIKRSASETEYIVYPAQG